MNFMYTLLIIGLIFAGFVSLIFLICFLKELYFPHHLPQNIRTPREVRKEELLKRQRITQDKDTEAQKVLPEEVKVQEEPSKTGKEDENGVEKGRKKADLSFGGGDAAAGILESKSQGDTLEIGLDGAPALPLKPFTPAAGENAASLGDGNFTVSSGQRRKYDVRPIVTEIQAAVHVQQNNSIDNRDTKRRSTEDNVYSEIPALNVKPLVPPRAVELGSLSLVDLTEEEKEEILMFKIRSVQDSLKLMTWAQLQCNLVIGIEANANGVGAYCVNLQKHTCQFYTYKVVCLPWDIEDVDDLVEVGMKNLLFALILWEDEISKAKIWRMYTGNRILNEYQEDPNVQKVIQLLKHYQECEKTTLVNSDEICIIENTRVGPGGINVGKEELAKFVRYVQPAVDLSQWRIKICERYLSNFYGIEKEGFTKTHCQMNWNKGECQPWYETTCAYSDFLEKVKLSREGWKTPCCKCGFVD